MTEVIINSLQSHPDEKLIVFSQFIGMLNLCQVPIRRRNIKYERFDGSMSATERDAAVHKFETDVNTRVLFISLKCGSLGLNLTCANRVILLDPWWNPATENR